MPVYQALSADDFRGFGMAQPTGQTMSPMMGADLGHLYAP
jgi:hypothetical protein